MKKRILCLTLAALLLAGNSAFGAGRTTRDLVFEEEETPAQKQEQSASQQTSGTQSISVKTTVVLTRDGQTSTVGLDHEFKSGDKVKLKFTPSIDGYVYWMAKGSSGNYSVLYPNTKAGNDNSVKKNNEYTVPQAGAFKFDNNAGTEELLCILSPTRLDDLDKAAAEQFGKTVAAMEQENASKRTTRDLVFEEEDEGAVNTKTQQSNGSEPFVSSYKLTHK